MTVPKEELKAKIKNKYYSFARKTFLVLFNTIYPVRFVNRELLTAENEPYILISNHNSNLDSLILMVLCPRQIRFLVKEELMQNPFIAWCIKKIHAIPVARHASDIGAFRKCIEAIRTKETLGIFPEGTRSAGGLMEHPEPGAALLALMHRMNLVPVYIGGRPRPFRVTKVIVGEKLSTASGFGKICSESIGKLSDAIRQRYAELSRGMQK